MVDDYTGNQYDDDLTVGMEDAEDIVYNGDVDLFEFYGEEETTIARLKTIILSIDWEITDTNLKEFNVELGVLKKELQSDKLNLVYAQALEKICKYIYKERANANPNAIKLLLRFFYKLEKNLSDESVTDAEKKNALIEDLKKFELLKEQIGKAGESTAKKPVKQKSSKIEKTGSTTKAVEKPEPITASSAIAELSDELEEGSPLMKLKAIVLGMDWEITEKELTSLGEEVKRLENEFSGQKPKLIFLQGIGVLGAYIRHRKSNAHADAFTLLHSFYNCLEKITVNDYSLGEEKAILLPEVEKFNNFKKLIANTIDKDAGDVQEAYDDNANEYDDIAPAFSDVDDDVRGFNEDAESENLKANHPEEVIDSKVESFFSEPGDTKPEAEQPVVNAAMAKQEGEAQNAVDSFFGEDAEEEELKTVPTEAVALQGVDVETEADDDSDEEPLPEMEDGELAPALVADGGERGYSAELDESSWKKTDEASEVFDKIDGFFGADSEKSQGDEEEVVADFSDEADMNIEAALQGVDVETDADDDSDEEPLLTTDEGEIAPALSDDDAAVTLSDGFAESEDDNVVAGQTEEDVTATLDSMFGEAEVEEPALVEDSFEELQQDEESIEALFDSSVEVIPEDVDEHVDSFFEEVEEESIEDEFAGVEEIAEEPVIADEDVDEHVASFFDDGDTDISEQVDDEVDAFFADESDDLLAEEEEDINDEEVADIIASNEEIAASVADISVADTDEVMVGESEVPDEDINIAGIAAGAGAVTAGVTLLNDDQAGSEEEELVVFELVEEETFDTEELQLDETAVVAENANEHVAEMLDDDESVSEIVASDFVEEEPETTLGADDEVFKPDADEELFNDEMLSEEDEVEESDEDSFDAENGMEGVFISEQLPEIEISNSVEDSKSGEENFTEKDEVGQDKVEFEEVGESVDVDEVVTFEEDEEDLDEYFKSTGLGETDDTDELAELKVCVASIGVELSDSIIQSLLSEINALRKKWYAKPASKTLLQLMSTVVQHVDQYRYEASGDAHGHILSICDKLELIERGEKSELEAQELLLAETSKVLIWQQKMLDRQAVKKGDSLTFIDPVRSDGEIAPKEIDFVFTEDHIVTDEFDENLDKEFEIVDDEDEYTEESMPDEIHNADVGAETEVEDFFTEEDEILQEDDEEQDIVSSDIAEKLQVFEDEDEKMEAMMDEEKEAQVSASDITSILRDELKELKLSLHEEIENLRKEINQK